MCGAFSALVAHSLWRARARARQSRESESRRLWLAAVALAPAMSAPAAAPKSKAAAPDKRSHVSLHEYALFCYLRLHPEVAKTYGIKICTGKTTIGSMLLQTLQAQGMHVEWHQRLPVVAAPPAKGSNEEGASYIKKARTPSSGSARSGGEGGVRARTRHGASSCSSDDSRLS